MPDEQKIDFDWIADTIFEPIYPLNAAAALEAFGAKEGRCLDLGAGGGHLGLAIAQASDMDVILLDLDEAAIEKARARIEERGLSKRVSACHGDACYLDFPEESFDLIVSRGSIGFWGKAAMVQKALLGVYRVLAPGGCTYIGGGCGNAAIQARIMKQMREVNPDYPGDLAQVTNGIETDEYRAIVQAAGLPGLVFEDETGMWILLRKPRESSVREEK